MNPYDDTIEVGGGGQSRQRSGKPLIRFGPGQPTDHRFPRNPENDRVAQRFQIPECRQKPEVGLVVFAEPDAGVEPHKVWLNPGTFGGTRTIPQESMNLGDDV